MKISVITVCYNSEKTIEDTIISVYKQTHPSIEYIVIDGKSQDMTCDIIKKYERLFKNKSQFKWISEKDKGIYDAINKGINLATGDIIGILNSDDFLCDNFVLSDINAIFRSNDIDCMYGDLIYVNKDCNKIKRKWVSNKFVQNSFERAWTPAHPTFYCKKELYKKYGVYDKNLKIVADTDLMYRFLQKKCVTSYYVNRTMVVMRVGGASSKKHIKNILNELKIVFGKNNKEFSYIKYLYYKIIIYKKQIINYETVFCNKYYNGKYII